MNFWHPITSDDQVESLQEFTDEEIENIDSAVDSVDEEVDLEEFAKKWNSIADKLENTACQSWFDDDQFVEP